MQRLFRVTAAFVAGLMMLAGIQVAPAAAAQDAPGLTGPTSYESPTFGYIVEWDKAWEAQADSTTSDNSGDVLYLFNEEIGAGVSITSLMADERGVDAYLDSYRTYLENTYGELTDGGFESADPDAPAFIVSYALESGTEIDNYVQVTMYQDAVIITSLRTVAGVALLAGALATVQIQFEGDNLFPSYGVSDDVTPTPEDDDNGNSGNKTDRPVTRDETPEADETPVPDDGLEHYTSPTYGVTLAYDPELWSEKDNLAADENKGRDLLLLDSAARGVRANIYFETYDSATKASDCFDTAISESVGNLAEATPVEDNRGKPIEGSSRGVKYGAYSFETSSGDTVVAYVECRALPGGAGVFATTLITDEDSWDDAFDATLDILDTVSLDGGSADKPKEEDTPEADETPTEESTRGNNGGSADNAYESPTYGFTIDYSSDWDINDEGSKNGVDQLVLDGPDGVTLLVQGYEPGRQDPQACTENYASSFGDAVESDLKVATNSDTDEPFAGESDFGYYGLYTYEGSNGTARAVYLECGLSPDGSYMVLFAAESSLDALETLLNEVLPIVESTNF